MLKILVSQNEAVQTHGDWENHPYPCHSSCFNHVWDKYAPPESPFSDCPVVCDSLGEIEPTSLGRHRLVTPWHSFRCNGWAIGCIIALPMIYILSGGREGLLPAIYLPTYKCVWHNCRDTAALTCLSVISFLLNHCVYIALSCFPSFLKCAQQHQR